jgi:Tol biopolymer transport system component
MEMSPDGSDLHEILSGWHRTDFKCCGFWSPDGSFFFFLSATSFEREGRPAYQIWAVDERRGWLHKHAEPVQLTFGPMNWFGGDDNFAGGFFTRDGRKILADGETLRGELVRYNRRTGRLEPFLDGISADGVDFSWNGKFVLYAPFPGDALLRASEDGTGVQQVLSGFNHPGGPRWSPDDTQIAFIHNDPDGLDSTYVVSSQGGTPVRVLPDNKCCNEVDPTWSSDGKQLAVWVKSPEGRTETELRIVNLATHQVSYLPRPPKQAFSPRWSPNGRYIICLTNFWPNTDGLEIYDFETNKWKIILSELGSGNWPSWSRDSRWIYYTASDAHRTSIFRISVNGGQPERIADLPGFRGTGWDFSWFGLDPDDNPIMLRDAGTNEVYALTLERK